MTCRTKIIAAVAAVFAALSVCGISDPALAQSSTVGQNIYVAPKGEYATIDVQSTKDAMARLQATPAGPEHDAAVADLVAKADRQSPVILFALAREYTLKGNYEEALFWTQAGYIRALYDGRRCTDPSAVSGASELMMTFGALFKDHQPDAAEWTRVSNRVLIWDDATPRNYDQRWICLHGMEAISTGLGNASSGQAVFLPEDQWPAILTKVHSDYRQAIDGLIAKMSAPK
ncbi:MAG TPA: hypothetical protein VG839_02715 [Asticcacaulis sp.]|nr:hypothetical protein [Asticcacaulis sp.]